MFARRLLYSLFVLGVLVFVIGYLMGWFDVSNDPDASGNPQIKVRVDQDKFERDATNAIEEAQDAGDVVKEKLNEE